MTSSIEIPSIPLPGDVSIPQFGVGVFQVPPEDTTENVLHGDRGRLPPHRHRQGLRQRGRGRPGDPRVGPGPLRVLRHDEVLQLRPRLRLRHARAQDEPRPARDGLRRPLPDPLARAVAGPLRGDVAGVHRGAGGRARPLHRRLELPARPPAPHHRRDRRHARRSTRSSCTPTSSRPACAASTPTAAS